MQPWERDTTLLALKMQEGRLEPGNTEDLYRLERQGQYFTFICTSVLWLKYNGNHHFHPNKYVANEETKSQRKKWWSQVTQ